MNLVYTYGGVVENNKDPLKLGRLKVRVPHVFGSTGGGSGFVPTNSLPWALPAGLPAGQNARSGGFSQLPEPGDKVWVRFLDGEPEKPIWEWGMQAYDDSLLFKLQSYKSGVDGSVGSPDRTAWTRYNHAVEMNEGGMILTTSGGYRVLLNDSSTPVSFDGSIKISTALGNMVEIDDSLNTLTLNILEDVNFQIGISFSAMSFDYTWDTTGDHTTNVGGKVVLTAAQNIEFSTAEAFSADTFGEINFDTATDFKTVSALSTSLQSGTTMSFTVGTDLNITTGGLLSLTSTGAVSFTSSAAMTMDFASLVMGSGSEPYVLGNQLLAFLLQFYTAYTTHTHVVTGVQSGGGSGVATPTTMPAPTPTSALLSTTILGR